VNKDEYNHFLGEEIANKNIGSFFNIQIKNAFLNITSINN